MAAFLFSSPRIRPTPASMYSQSSESAQPICSFSFNCISRYLHSFDSFVFVVLLGVGVVGI